MATKKHTYRAAPLEPINFDGFDEFLAANAVQPEPEKSGGLSRFARDVGVGALKSAVGLPEAFVGMADLATGGHAGRLAERAGVRFKDAQQILDTWYSPETQEAKRQFQEAEGIGGKFGAAVANPSVVGTTVLESLAQMGGGAGIARGIMSKAPSMSALMAGAIGEGAMGAGSSAEQIRQQTDDGLLSAKQAGLAALSGVGTAAFGAAGGKVAQRLGIGDVDTMLAQGSRQSAQAAVDKGVTRRFLEGAVSEGFLEELPQSLQEQVLQNAALDRPLDEGVDGAAVLGVLSGMAMGGPAGALSRGPEPAAAAAPPPIVPPSGPLSRAANAGAAVGPPAAPLALGYNGRTEDVLIPAEDGTLRVQTPDERDAIAAEKQRRIDLGLEELRTPKVVAPADETIIDAAPGDVREVDPDTGEVAPPATAAPILGNSEDATRAPAAPASAFASLDEADAYVDGQMKMNSAAAGVPVENEDGTIALVPKSDPRHAQAVKDRLARKKARRAAAKTTEPSNDLAGEAAQPGPADAGAVPGTQRMGGQPADLGAMPGPDAPIAAGDVRNGGDAAESGRGQRNDALSPPDQTAILPVDPPAAAGFKVGEQVETPDGVGVVEAFPSGRVRVNVNGKSKPYPRNAITKPEQEAGDAGVGASPQEAPASEAGAPAGVDAAGPAGPGPVQGAGPAAVEAAGVAPAADDLLAQARQIVLADGRASISSVQRQLRIGYNRAARLVETLELEGLVSPMRPDGSREVIGKQPAQDQGAPVAPTGDVQRNSFGLPMGYAPTGRQRTKTAAELQAGDWINDGGRLVQVRGVAQIDGGKVAVDADTGLARMTLDLDGTKAVTVRTAQWRGEGPEPSAGAEPEVLTPAPVAEDAPEATWTRATEADRYGILARAGWAATGDKPSTSAQRAARMPWAKLSESQRARIGGALSGAAPAAQAGPEGEGAKTEQAPAVTGSDADRAEQQPVDAGAGSAEVEADGVKGEPAKREPIEHSGLKVYPTRYKSGEKVVDGWAVQLPDNKGTDKALGDTLHPTLEAAKKDAELLARHAAERAETRAKIEAQEKAEAAEREAKKGANRQLSVVERRANAVLDKPVSEYGKPTTRRAIIQANVDMGHAFVEKKVFDSAAKKRDEAAVEAARRAGYILGASNENIPVVKAALEAQARLKAKQYDTKPEYRMYLGKTEDGPFREITKIEYDYAQRLIAEKNTAGAEKAAEKVSDQAQDEWLPDGWSASENGFTKRPVFRKNQDIGQPFAVVTNTAGMTYEVEIRHGDKAVDSARVIGARSEALAKADAMLAKATGTAATHQDPGQNPEAVTPAVVKESLTKAAKNEDRKPSQMKADLLRMIDEAIAKAPEEGFRAPVWKEPTKEQLRQVMVDNGFTDTQRARQMMVDSHYSRVEEAAEKVGHITFDVPGDGKFRVINDRERLADFRKKVEASSGFKDKAPAAPVSDRTKNDEAFGVERGSGATQAAIINMLAEGDYQAAKDYADFKGLTVEDWSAIGQKLSKRERAELNAWVAEQREQATEQPTGEADEQAQEQPVEAAQEAPVEAADTLTPAQAKKQTEWRDLGTRDGVKTHQLVFKEADDNNGFVIATLTRFGNGKWTLDDAKLDGENAYFEGLKEAKAAAVDRGMAYLQREGYVAKDAAPDAPAAAPEPAPAPAPVSSPEGQKNLAYRGSRIAALKAMNDQLRKLAPNDAWLDKNIEQADDLDALQDQISKALVDAQKGPETANPLRAELEEMSGKELSAVFERMGLAGARWTHSEKVEALLAEDQDAVRAAMNAAAAPAEPAKPATITDVGEKIGGARKDTAERGFTRGPKAEKDERPAWARRFEISQIVTPGGMLGEVKDAGRWVIRDNKSLDWTKQPKQVGRQTFATREEAEAFVPIAAVGLKHRPVPTREGKFEIWRDITDRKRVKVVDHVFDTRDEAMAYMLANAVAIVETNTTFGEADIPTPPDRQRTGAERRTGNVVGDDFKDAFGLRAVEFGNWNNQDERQALMNDAWDGLMDLADVLGLPPKALGMNGQLALAFGARGHGLQGARAHYELEKLVINLTKEKGAGSLAHEWFHALDHYFGRQDGKASAEWVVGKDGTRSIKVSDEGQAFVSHGFGYKSQVREEVRAAYKKLMETMFKKAETFVQDTQQADKFVGAAKQDLERELQKLRASLAEQKDPQYWKRNNKPASAEQLAEFDAIAKQMLDAELSALDTDWKSLPNGKDKVAHRWTNDSLERLNAIFKEVRGRSGFNAEKKGVLDYLRANMARYSQRLKMLAEAQDGAEKSRAVPTEFAMNAKELDQGRGGDYWTTPHEMAARAFQAYVEDKIAERGGSSRFLTYGPENAGILTPWGWKRPFPAGQERVAINTAFDAFLGQIKTREDDAGNVAMFSRRSSGRGVTRRDAEAAVDLLRRELPSAPEIVLLDRVQDAPAALQATIRARGAENDVEAVYEGGVIYAFPGNFIDMDRFMFVVGRHEVRHAGFDAMLGQDKDAILMSIGRANRRVALEARKLMDDGFADSFAEGVEEALADMTAEDVAALSRIKLAVAAIRRWLRATAFKLRKAGWRALADAIEPRTWSDNDVIAFVKRAEDVSRGPGGGGGARFSRSGDVQERTLVATNEDGLPEFQYGGTKLAFPIPSDRMEVIPVAGQQVLHYAIMPSDSFDVLGHVELLLENGRPVSLLDIEAYSKGGGVGRQTVETLLRALGGQSLNISNIVPAAQTFWERMGVPTQNLEEGAAYDGNIDLETFLQAQDGAAARAGSRSTGGQGRSADAGAEAGAPGPTQGSKAGRLSRASRQPLETVRDAAFRSGEAVKELNLLAGYKVGDFLQSTGKLSWWDKSVGTPYNLAKRSPEFARVYDAVQSFLSDVSYYAKEAANLAPSLLPDLDKLSDLKKKPISPADNKAVAAPIFEGTLGWTRDEDGKPITMEQAEAAAEQMSADDKAHKLLRDKELDPGVLRMWQGQELDRYEAMVNTRYASVYLRPGVVWSDAELRSKFSLTDEQIGLYKEFRTAVDRSLDDLAAAEIRRLTRDTLGDMPMEEGQDVDAWAMAVRDRLFEAEDDALADQVVKIANRLKDLKAHGYAPLSRFGHFTVDVMQDGERVYFGMYESQAEANRAARKLAESFPGAEITQGTMSTEGYKQFAGVSPETLALFGEAMGLDKDAVYQEYLKRAVATRSALKRLIHRKGIAGFSEDVGRVLAGFVTSNARRASSQDHMGEIGEATEAIPKEQGELKDYAIKFGEYVKNPTEEAQAIRGVLFAQYLGGSISSALVNMTQPFTVAFPYLSQFGGVAKAGAALTKAMKDMANGKLEDDLAQAMKRAEEDGVVAPQEIHQLMAQARGVGGLQSGDGTKSGDAAATVQNHYARLQLVWGKLFGFAEMTNRRMTYIAAYRMAKANGNPDPDAFARKAINDTMFVMNKGNRPQWARGSIGATLFTFKSYMVSYLELMARMYRQGGPEGKRAFWLGLAVLLLMGGGDELPFMENIEDLVDGVAQNLLGLNWQSKAKRHEFMADLLGKDLAEFLNRGVSSIGPVDVTGRFGMGSPIPGTGLFRRDTQDTGRDWAQILGPVGDLVPRMARAGGMALRGDIGKAALEASPVAVRNVAKGVDMANTGMYKDTKGRKVIETDAGDALWKGIGFQPAEVGQVQSASVTKQRMIALNKSVETEIADLWAKGRFEKDPAKVEEARAKLREWNAQNPDSPIKLQMGQIQQRVNKMSETKAERLAKTAPKEIRESVRRELKEASQ